MLKNDTNYQTSDDNYNRVKEKVKKHKEELAVKVKKGTEELKTKVKKGSKDLKEKVSKGRTEMREKVSQIREKLVTKGEPQSLGDNDQQRLLNGIEVRDQENQIRK
jgi:hypothetical protein